QQPEQHADRRRLAGAVRPEEPGDLAGCDRQVQAVEGRDVPESLVQPADLDRRGGRGHDRSPSWTWARYSSSSSRVAKAPSVYSSSAGSVMVSTWRRIIAPMSAGSSGGSSVSDSRDAPTEDSTR